MSKRECPKSLKDKVGYRCPGGTTSLEQINSMNVGSVGTLKHKFTLFHLKRNIVCKCNVSRVLYLIFCLSLVRTLNLWNWHFTNMCLYLYVKAVLYMKTSFFALSILTHSDTIHCYSPLAYMTQKCFLNVSSPT